MRPLDPRVIAEIAKEEPEYAAQLAREYRKAMIVLAREDPSWFCAYVLRNATDGSQIYQHPDHEALHRAILDCPRVAIWTHPGLGKALPLDTEIPTPSGWKKMGELSAGDCVYSRDGGVYPITYVTPVQHQRKLYKVQLDDGAHLTADENHEWVVLVGPTQEERALTTLELVQLLRKSTHLCIPQHRALVNNPRVPYRSHRITYEYATPQTAEQEASQWRKSGYKTYHRDNDDRLYVCPKEKTRTIVSVRSAGVGDVRCISVASPDHTFIAGRGYVVTHNCTPADANVLYEDGTWRKVGDLQAGDKLLTWSPEKHALTPVTASLIDNGPKPILKIKTADGAVLRVTENHPLLRSDLTWVRADSLAVGEEVVAINHLDMEGTTTEQELPAEEAEILGYLFAGRIGRNESVIVRRLNESPKWSARRKQLFESAGWEVLPYKEHAYIVKNTPAAAMSPAIFLASLAKIEHGWPVEFAPEVYKLRTGPICRLLTAFFSAAYFSTRVSGPRTRTNKLAGTFGIADTRLPLFVGHTSWETLDSVRRLCLRTGAKVSLRQATYGLAQQGTYGGIFPPHKARTKRRNLHYKLYVLPEDLGRFWPACEVPASPPALLKRVRIVSITKSVKPMQTWGIEIAEKEHSYIQEGLVVHNTNQIAIGHVLWRIGKNPNCSIGMVCNTSEMAERTVSAIKQYIAYSQEYKDVFPNIRPGEVWASTKITVDRETIRRDPTLQAVGLTGNIVGARLDGLVLDDVDNIDSTLTEAARDQTEQRIRKQVISRLDSAGWAVAIGNVWHEKDLMHRLVKSGWQAMRFPILKYDPEAGDMVTRDPVMFPIERVYQIRDFDQGPIEFERLYMLKARIDGEQRFKVEWIEQALELGKQQVLMRQGVPKVPNGCRTITGVDLGIKLSAKNDPTVITTILEVPKSGNQYDYQVLNIVKGRWNAQEIMDRIKEQQRLFMSEVWVEDNGAQNLLIQLMNMSGLSYKINAFRTGMNKYDPMFGIEALAAEMALGKWYIPSWDGTREGCEEEVDELIEEMLAYQPNNHTGDLLMSLWIARDGSRQSREKNNSKVQFGRLRLGRNR